MDFQLNDKDFIANVKCSDTCKMFIINGKFMMRKMNEEQKPHINITRGGRKCECIEKDSNMAREAPNIQ